MDAKLSEATVEDQWPALRQVVRDHAQPDIDLWRKGLHVYVRALSRERPDPAEGAHPTATVRDEYVFLLDCHDFNDHAPRIYVCDPLDPEKGARGHKFAPLIDANNVFASDNFLCMPGDRRCYEGSDHKGWNDPKYFVLEDIVRSLFALVRHHNYRRPRA